MLIERSIKKQIEQVLFRGKVIVVYGPRQVGKTTLVKEIAHPFGADAVYFNCDEPDIREKLTNKTSTELQQFVLGKRLVVIDEAQRVHNIGLTLKLLVDTMPQLQVIATGSAALTLSNDISEPLTGRKFEFILYPFSLSELQYRYSLDELNRLLPNILVFGTYPDVALASSQQTERLYEYTKSYLFNDVLTYQQVKNPELLRKLLEALALQLGQEVSYNELAKLVGVDKATIARYIDLLEQAYIVFRIRSYSRNRRNELTKLRKVYFYDLGIRNAIIRQLNPITLRTDVGALWENFFFVERLKYNQRMQREAQLFFWRTHQQQEIDCIEEVNGSINAWECKWRSVKKTHAPKAFQETYPGTPFYVVTNINWQSALLP